MHSRLRDAEMRFLSPAAASNPLTSCVARTLQTPELPQAEDSPLLPLVASVLESVVEVNEHKEQVAMQVRTRA